jgi:hypothetical protein
MNPTIEPTPNTERPKEVTGAVRLVAASFAIGGVRAVFDLAQKVSGISFLVALLILVVFLGICFFFVSRIAAGKNWARIVFLVLFLIGLPLALPGYIADLRINFLHGAISIIIALLQLIGTYLLFTRNSNVWFRRRK